MKAASPAPDKAVATSVKLPAALKARIDDTARKAGLSAHAFMVKTLGEATERAQLREQFTTDSEQALGEVQESGLAYDFDDVRAYFAARARGENPPRPRRRPWRGAMRA